MFQNRYRVALGLELSKITEPSWPDSILDALNHGDLRDARRIILSNGFYEQELPGGYSSLVPNANNEIAVSYYLSYRFSESQNDLDANFLRRLLIESLANITSADGECLNELLEIEYDFLSITDSVGAVIREGMFIKLRNHLEKHGALGRVAFLWAKVNYRLGNFEESLRGFQELLEEGKYEREIYNIFLEYYTQNNLDSARRYIQKLTSAFPDDCSRQKMQYFLAINDSSSFLREVKCCFSSLRVNDSIIARVRQAQFYFNNKSFSKVEKIVQDYYNNDSLFSFNVIQKWERRQYFELMSRVYLQQNRIKDLCKYIMKMSAEEASLNFYDEQVFQEFIRKLYKDSKVLTAQDFEAYYTERIKPVYLNEFRQ